MTTASLTRKSLAPAHRAFLVEQPRIDNVLRLALRRRLCHRHCESITDGRAAA